MWGFFLCLCWWKKKIPGRSQPSPSLFSVTVFSRYAPQRQVQSEAAYVHVCFEADGLKPQSGSFFSKIFIVTDSMTSPTFRNALWQYTIITMKKRLLHICCIILVTYLWTTIKPKGHKRAHSCLRIYCRMELQWLESQHLRYLFPVFFFLPSTIEPGSAVKASFWILFPWLSTSATLLLQFTAINRQTVSENQPECARFLADFAHRRGHFDWTNWAGEIAQRRCNNWVNCLSPFSSWD